MTNTFGITIDDVRLYPWQDLIKNSPEKEAMSYHGLFSKALADCQNAADSRGANVYRFLGGMTSWMPSYDDSNSKYQPMFTGAIAPENYDEGDLDVLEKLLPEITDAEFRSRVADLLWIRRKKKNPDHVRIAVPAFLESAATLETDKFDYIFTGRIKRAVQLSAVLGRENIPATDVATLRKTITGSGRAFSFLFATEYLNEEGKTVGRTEGTTPTAKELEEQHLKAKMFEMASRFQWSLRVQTTIMPALSQINSEQNIEPKDLAFLLLHNPFLSPGREDIIARALLAGFRGDCSQSHTSFRPRLSTCLGSSWPNRESSLRV
jgi:hypothetical protein